MEIELMTDVDIISALLGKECKWKDIATACETNPGVVKMWHRGYSKPSHMKRVRLWAYARHVLLGEELDKKPWNRLQPERAA